MTGPPLPRGDWLRVLTDPDDLGELAAKVADVSAVLPGDESAVPLAESLAAKLGLPGNDPYTTASRTDKTVMQLTLARAGLPHPMTAQAATLEAALATAEAMGWPVVVKPRWSASSVGVRICHCPPEVVVAWAAATGKKGDLGEITQVMAVQEYLDGQKWTVDTVTVPGPGDEPVHVVTSMWRERVSEVDGHIAWGESWLVPPAAAEEGDEAAAQVTAYTRRVLDVAGVVRGPACTEIKLTARGPRLVETMARLAGCYPVHLVQKVTGQSQVTTTVDALADPGEVARRRPPAGDGSAVAQLWLAAPYDAVLDGSTLARILSLPSVVTASSGLVAGATVRRTIDSPSSPGQLDLHGPPGQVKLDITMIRALERSLYRRGR
jgi:biotin carboxylase